MTLISTVTVGSGGAASIDFTSIPGTYTDLLLVVSARTTNGAVNDALSFSINGVTTNQSRRRLQGDGSSATSNSNASAIELRVNGDTATANTFGNASVYIPNYAGSTNKSISQDSVTENNATTSYQDLVAALWSSTAAITSLSVAGQGTTIKQYSTASLYGILKGSGGATVS